MRCQAGGQNAGLPSWQALGPVALEQREVCPEECQPFGPVREMNLFLLN